jgi:hypothetical protein
LLVAILKKATKFSWHFCATHLDEQYSIALRCFIGNINHISSQLAMTLKNNKIKLKLRTRTTCSNS